MNITKNNKLINIKWFNFRIPIEWLLQQIKTNPTFAIKLTQVLMNERTDFISMMDRSNSERITWLY